MTARKIHVIHGKVLIFLQLSCPHHKRKKVKLAVQNINESHKKLFSNMFRLAKFYRVTDIENVLEYNLSRESLGPESAILNGF